MKRLVMQGLHVTGLLWLLLAWRTRQSLIVLTYHRVLPAAARPDSFSADGIIVTPESFERHMRLLARRFNVLTPDEFAAVLEGSKPLPPRACLVTFDDGWWDNLEYAAPVLNRHRVPALLFVATDYVGSDRVFWQERLSSLLMQAHGMGEPARALFQELNAEPLLATNGAALRPALRAVIDGLKHRPPAQIQQILTSAEDFLAGHGINPRTAPADRFLSWPQLSQLLRESPFLIGSHGCSHVPFTRLPPAELAIQLSASRERIAEQLGVPVRDLAYPNGDCDPDVARQTREAGYRLAFSTERGYVRAGDDRQRLRRINIHEHGTSNDAMFLARLAGLS